MTSMLPAVCDVGGAALTGDATVADASVREALGFRFFSQWK